MIFKKFSTHSFIIYLAILMFCLGAESKTENNAQTEKAISRKIKANKTMDNKALKLSNYRWENRLLVVADMDSEAVLKQQQLFDKNPTQNKDRKLLLLKIKDLKILKDLKLKTDIFAMVLIGLDGYVKNRYSKVTEMSEIYDVIDAMPMRQREERN